MNIATWMEQHRVSVAGLTTDNIIGHKAAKRQLQSLADALRDPSAVQAAGASLPRGILFFGEPGTGKTLSARVLASMLGDDVAFYEIGSADISSERIGEIAEWARKENTRIVIYVDEIDRVALDRGSELHTDETRSALFAMLSALDGLRPGGQILWLASSNRGPNQLDPAIVRAGRFGQKVFLRAPERGDRLELFRYMIENRSVAGPLDLARAADATSGKTQAEIIQLLDDATMLALMDGKSGLTWEHLRESIERGGITIEKEEKPDETWTWRVAIHESAHVAACLDLLGDGSVSNVHILGDRGGITNFAETGKQLTTEIAAGQLVALAAGEPAERIILGAATMGCQSDHRNATSLAREIVDAGTNVEFGWLAHGQIPSDMISGTTAERYNDTLRALLREARNKAEQVVKDQTKFILAFARILQAETQLSGERLAIAIDHARKVAACEELPELPEFPPSSEEVVAPFGATPGELSPEEVAEELGIELEDGETAHRDEMGRVVITVPDRAA